MVVDFDNVASKAKTIKPIYSPPKPIFGFHLNQSQPSALFGIPASNDCNRSNFASYGKVLIQFGFVGVDRQITYVQFCSHV